MRSGQLAAEGLVELRRNRGAAVATPSWDEARDMFDVRLGLERLVVSRLAGRLTRGPDQARSNRHVDEEERARGNNEPLSIRLATEFHILLAEMTGSPVLDALCQRGRVALRADSRALQPAAFRRNAR